MSLNIPPDCLRYLIDGGEGSRLVIIIFSSFPIFPLRSSFLRLLWPGSYLLLNPNWIFGFDFLIFFLHSFILLIFKSKGFSQKIAFLYLTASSINLIWVDVVEAIKIASNFLSLNAIEGLLTGVDFKVLEIF